MKLLKWFLVLTGHRQMGNYFLVDGKYRHIERIKLDTICGVLFSLLLLGWLCVMWLMLVII